jgi:tetratricopeptide (TPR) repeat protein
MKRRIKKLNERDSFHLKAAEGWFELGDSISANSELDEISPGDRAHPAVLIMRYEIYSKAEKWDYAIEIANALLKMLPEDAESWLNMAFTVRRKTGGSIREAKEMLLEAEPKFPKDYSFPYNLACYCSQLREFTEAKQWLKKAAKINDAAVKKMALDDPDFKPLWASLGGTLWDNE